MSAGTESLAVSGVQPGPPSLRTRGNSRGCAAFCRPCRELRQMPPRGSSTAKRAAGIPRLKPFEEGSPVTSSTASSSRLRNPLRRRSGSASEARSMCCTRGMLSPMCEQSEQGRASLGLARSIILPFKFFPFGYVVGKPRHRAHTGSQREESGESQFQGSLWRATLSRKAWMPIWGLSTCGK